MRPVLLSVLALFAVALVRADGSVTGKYRNRSAVSRSSSKSELTLRVNGRFLLERDGKLLHGDYRVEDGLLTLRTETGDRIRGKVAEGRITLDGEGFDRVSGGGVDLANRRFPTDASTDRLRRNAGREDHESRSATVEPPRAEGFGAPLNKTVELVITELFVAAPVIVPASPSVVVEPAMRPIPVRKFEADEFVGAWTVRREGFEEKGWRMDLKKNGQFRFSMKGLTSEGEWTVVDNEIVLVYKKVDGEPLEEGATGVKRIPVAFDASAFKIDTYRYERATAK